MPAIWLAPMTWVATVGSAAANMNTYVRNNLLWLKQNILLEAPVELTIAAGTIAITQTFHTVDTQDNDLTDDLDSIGGGAEGRIIILRAEHTDHTVILKNGANLLIGADISLDDTNKHIALICDGAGDWHLLYTARDVTFMANAFQYPAPGTDWTPAITGATLAVNMATKKCWLPLNFLKIGDQIVSYKIVGDMVEGGGDTCTFDCKLVRVNKVDLGTTDVGGGGIVKVEDDGNFDVEATLAALETVATDNQYLLELKGSTSNNTTTEFIGVMGAEVLVRRLV